MSATVTPIHKAATTGPMLADTAPDDTSRDLAEVKNVAHNAAAQLRVMAVAIQSGEAKPGDLVEVLSREAALLSGVCA